jgi:hypothetical protein
MLRKMPQQPQFIRRAGSIDRLSVPQMTREEFSMAGA